MYIYVCVCVYSQTVKIYEWKPSKKRNVMKISLLHLYWNIPSTEKQKKKKEN